MCVGVVWCGVGDGDEGFVGFWARFHDFYLVSAGQGFRNGLCNMDSCTDTRGLRYTVMGAE